MHYMILLCWCLLIPDTAISNSTIARHLQNQLITTKIAGNDSDVLYMYERNRPNTIEQCFQYATWLINLGQYLHLPVCATSSFPSFTGVHQCQVYIDESGFNIFFSKNQRPCTVRRTSPPRRSPMRKKRHIARMGLVHHAIEQRTVTRATFQAFMNELVVFMAPRINERSLDHFSTPSSKPITAWRVRSNNIWCFLTFQLKFSIFKTCGWRLVSISTSSEPTCCFKWEQNALQQITQQKCANWCARIHRYIPASLSIEKSFAIKSEFINVNKYIVIVNAHFVRKFWKWVWISILLNWMSKPKSLLNWIFE